MKFFIILIVFFVVSCTNQFYEKSNVINDNRTTISVNRMNN